MYRVLILIVCMFLSGCTYLLWSQTPEQVVNVNGFYVNTETKDLVVTTRREAYLFPSQQQLGQALILSREVEFRPQFKDFSLSRSNVVTGNIKLTLREETPSAELIDKLIAVGFTKNPVTDHYQLVGEVRGMRYLIEGELPLEKLEKEYTVSMNIPRGPIDTAGRVVATPVAIVFDAVAAIPFTLMAYLMSHP